jgi:diguanylate cyclase (GGDEF)-like protein
VDDLGRCQWIGAAAASLLGHHPDEIVGTLLSSWFADQGGSLEEALAAGEGTCSLRAAERTLVATVRRRMPGTVVTLRPDAEGQIRVGEALRRTTLRFVNLAAEAVEAEIGRALGDVARLCRVDRAYVLTFDHQRGVAQVTAHYAAANVAELPPRRHRLAFDSLALLLQPLFALDAVVIERAADVADASDAEALATEGIGSLAIVPLGPDRLRLAVGFEVLGTSRHWEPDELLCLRAMAEVFGAVVAPSGESPSRTQSPAQAPERTTPAAPERTTPAAPARMSVPSEPQPPSRVLIEHVTRRAGSSQDPPPLLTGHDAVLAQQALQDVLTGLPNRRLFLSHLEHAIAGLTRHPSLTAVLFFDLDRFKSINDTIGHAVGDELLVVAAQRLRAALRPEDVVARLGGDEFVVLLENLNEPIEAVQAAERLLGALSLPAMLSGHEVTTGASIGVALTSDGSIPPDEMLIRADTAMYRAKQRGRGRVEVFDEELRASVNTKLQMAAELREALDAGQLEVHYQPEVDLVTGELIAVEALARWRHRAHGLLAAASFVPVAEETGLIVAIGTKVLRDACLVGESINRLRPSRPLVMHVNMSARQLTNATMVTATITDALRAANLDPELLCLDIGEATFGNEQHGPVIRELRGLGVQIALDDFGTSASSLTNLGRLGLREVKIDAGLVAQFPDPVAVATVTSMVAAVQALGITIAAEGIESAETSAALIALGCGRGQGFYLGPPAPAASLTY